MRIRKKLFYLPLISIASFLSLIYLIFVFPPNLSVLIVNYPLPVLPFFFLLFFVFLWSLVGFIFANRTQGFLVASFPTIYLILRFFKLNQMFFLVLLILLFAGLELLFYRKR